ncbi:MULTISPECIES: hypothetical protein [Burkholderia]|uniref:hypothetical protein n=1 Tax=Burkholderia TaxID=32008 RepID=UPI000B7A03BF|nr:MULTISPECIES: hypothetical protein [Burkholderia]OXI93300.1 hypothetical protein CFB41_33195 [Burkholderia sp. AU33803]PRD91973.1 hypothetical protein C6P88_17095 [Burkholderia contaminans]
MASDNNAHVDAHRDRLRPSSGRIWPAAALAVPLALGCTLAHGESLMEQLSTLNGIAYARTVDSMDGHALLGNLIGDQPRNLQEAGLLARIDGENLFMNARAVAGNHSLGAQSSRFNEAGVRYAFDNGITLTAGKRIDPLDTSQAFFPLGFFQKRAATADIYDRYGDVEGTPLVEAKWAGEQTTLQFIAGENRTLRSDVDNRDVQGATQLVRGAYNWSGGSAALLAGRHAGHGGAGATLSFDVARSNTVYASAWLERGTTRPLPAFIANGTPLDSPAAYDAVDRRNDRQIMWRSAVGMQSALPGNFSLIVEWSHDEARYDANQWRQMVGAARVNNALLPVAPGAALAGLGGTADFVSVDGNLRDYLFARLGKKIGRVEYSLRGVYSPQDKGLLAIAQVVADVNKRVSVDVAVTRAFSDSNSEYRMVGLGTRIDAAVRVRF